MIRPCLKDIINDNKTKDGWKIQFAMTIYVF